MPADYEVEYTRLARAALGKQIGVFEERLRGELADELPEDYYAPEIMFHAIEYDDRLLIALGNGDYLLVDTATEEQGPLIDRGSMRGKRIVMPRPDSEE
jgi:hypothetical protein